VNAAELLQKELARLQPDVIACGDWQQPAFSDRLSQIHTVLAKQDFFDLLQTLDASDFM
jgi:hypothetical protein